MIGISALVIVAGGIAFYRSLEALYFALGVILTSSLNVFKVILLERTVKKVADMEEPDVGKNYVRFQYLLRYFLTGMVLLAAGLVSVYVKPPFINIWGAVAGIFTLQIAVIIVRSMKLEEDVQG
jgi:hypothetical protein